MIALKNTNSRCPMPTPLHQPVLHYTPEGLTGQLTCRRMESSYSHWSGVLKSTSAMTKMDAKSYHRRSRANSSALPVQFVRKWPDVPSSGSGSLASGALPPEIARKQPGEPPKIDLQGVDSVDEACARTPPNPPSTPPLLRYGGRVAERRYRRT